MTLDRLDSGRVSLNGLTLLVVEDETIVSFLLEDMLIELGCSTVLQAGRVNEALTLLRERTPDAVVLDVNLAGEYAFPVAEHLAKVQIPFVFTTGYGRGGIPKEWASWPVLQKPFSLDALADALRAALPHRPEAQ
jgi:CheY-like chemotaxis protein